MRKGIPLAMALLSALLVPLAAAGEAGSLRLARGCVAPAIARAGRPTTVIVEVTNPGRILRDVAVDLALPPGAEAEWTDAPRRTVAVWGPGATQRLAWRLTLRTAVSGEARVVVRREGETLLDASFPVAWTPPVAVRRSDYVPAPEPADTGRTLVGAFMCPLWSARAWEPLGGRDCWAPVLPYREREPALGWYDEGDPEVTDWEIKWCLEHGIRFLVPCWYRARGNAGKPVEHVLGHWLHEGLFKSRYGDRMQFAILWENGNPIASGVASEEDLLRNVLPYWIEHYFRRPNYLRIDGKPLLFIYRMDVLARELGGIGNVRAALAKMREACVRAGFRGLLVLGEHHLRMEKPVPHLAEAGLDYACSYHWPSFAGLMPAERRPEGIIDAQEQCWRALGSAAGAPALVTASMGWDSRPWGSADPGWRLAPGDFRALLERARGYLARQPSGSLESRMLLLDNWNEFGEGHYLFPHREHGFGHLDAVRDLFAPGAGAHTDLVPEDVGRGPYDRLYREADRKRRALGGWFSLTGQAELSAGRDALSILCKGNDPQIANHEVPAVRGGVRVAVRMRSDAGGVGQLFWATEAERGFAAGRSTTFPAIHDNAWREYVVRVETESPLARLRLDPCAGPGRVEVQWIRVETEDGTVVKEWRFGAGASGGGSP